MLKKQLMILSSCFKKSSWITILAIILSMFSCGESNRDYGAELYTEHCANCHGIKGQGLQDLYPPLKGSDYLIENQADLACMIRFGLEGEVEVNGKLYNEKMPSLATLSEVDMANIINYISKNIEPKVARVTLPQVKTRVYDCK